MWVDLWFLQLVGLVIIWYTSLGHLQLGIEFVGMLVWVSNIYGLFEALGSTVLLSNILCVLCCY